MNQSYTAVIRNTESWWIGWVEELSGVNCQAATREELMEDLKSALEEAIEMNRADAIAAVEGSYEEVSLSP